MRHVCLPTEHVWTTWKETKLGHPKHCTKCGVEKLPPFNPDDPFEYRDPPKDWKP